MLWFALLLIVIGAGRLAASSKSASSKSDEIRRRISALTIGVGTFVAFDWRVDRYHSPTMLLAQEISSLGIFLMLGAIGIAMLDWRLRGWCIAIAGLGAIVVGANRIGPERRGGFDWFEATDWISRTGHLASVTAIIVGSGLMLAGAHRAWPPTDWAERSIMVTLGGTGLISAACGVFIAVQLVIAPETLAARWHIDEWMWIYPGCILLAASGAFGLARRLLRRFRRPAAS